MLNSFDSIVVSSFMGLTAVGIYGNYYYIISAVIGFTDVVYNAILPTVGNRIALSGKKAKQVYNWFKKLNFILIWFVSICSVCILCLIQPFMIFWVGEKNLFPFSTVIIIAIYFFAFKARLMLLNFKEAAGMWEKDFWKPYIGILVNLSLNIILVICLGVNGVFIATIITMWFVYMPWEIYVVFKYIFNLSPKEYIIEYICLFFSNVIVGVVSYLFTNLISIEGIVGLLVKGIVCFIISNITFCIMNINNNTFKNIISEIKMRLKNHNIQKENNS